jgi:hypothetical protein
MRALICTALVATTAFTGLAQAEETGQPITREQVQAEYQRARAAGELDYAYEVMGGPTATVGARQQATRHATGSTEKTDTARSAQPATPSSTVAARQ